MRSNGFLCFWRLVASSSAPSRWVRCVACHVATRDQHRQRAETGWRRAGVATGSSSDRWGVRDIFQQTWSNDDQRWLDMTFTDFKVQETEFSVEMLGSVRNSNKFWLQKQVPNHPNSWETKLFWFAGICEIRCLSTSLAFFRQQSWYPELQVKQSVAWSAKAIGMVFLKTLNGNEEVWYWKRCCELWIPQGFLYLQWHIFIHVHCILQATPLCIPRSRSHANLHSHQGRCCSLVFQTVKKDSKKAARNEGRWRQWHVVLSGIAWSNPFGAWIGDYTPRCSWKRPCQQPFGHNGICTAIPPVSIDSTPFL